MNLQKWFNETVSGKVLKVLDGLAEEITNNGQPDLREAVRVFADFCNDDLKPEDKLIVDGVINTLNFTNEVNALRAFWGKIPEQLRKIFTTSLDSFEKKEIKWDILKDNGTAGLNFVDLKESVEGSTISFGAKAELALALQALNSSDADQAIGMKCKDSERFLRMGAMGKLEANADVSVPLPFVGIKGKGKGRAEAYLDYYYLNEAQWLIGEALVHHLRHLVSPFDAIDIAAGKEYRLQAIQLSVKGSLGASLSLSGGKTWGASFNVKNKSLDLDTDVQIGAGVDVGFNADLNLKGAWKVLVKPQNHGILRVEVQKDWSKEKSISFFLDASVGISGLDKIGEAVIKNFLPDATRLLEKLKEYSNFGSFLKKEIKGKLNDLLNADADNTLKKELISVLVGDDQAGDLADTIGNAVETTLYEKLDQWKGKVSGSGEEIIDEVVKKLDSRGKLGDRLTGILLQTAKGKLDTFLNDIESKLKVRLEKIISETERKYLKPLFKPLESVGKIVVDFTADADKLSQELLAPVISFLTRYQQQRNKIVKVVQASSRLKLGLHLGRSLKSSSEKSTVLEFEVDTNEENAVGHYKEIMVGNFKNALTAARKGENGSDGIRLCGGSFKASVMNQLTTDVTFNFFGSAITAQTIMSSDVDVKVDASGNVMVGKTLATFMRRFEAFGESRIVRFINMMEIAGTTPADQSGAEGDQSEKTKIFSSGLSMTYEDTGLKASELNAYLGSLEKVKLISRESLIAADRKYYMLAKQAESENKKMGAEIGLSMALTSDDINKMINTEDGSGDRLTDEQIADIETKAIKNQINTYFIESGKETEFNSVLAKWYDRSPDFPKQIRRMAEHGKLGPVLIRYNIKDIHDRRDQDKVPTKDRHYLNVALDIGLNAVKLVNIVRNLKKAAGIRFSADTLKAKVEELNGYNKKINKYLKSWLEIGGVLKNAGIEKETIPPVTLAFIATIGQLCKMGEEFLIPTVKWSVLDWKEEIFV